MIDDDDDDDDDDDCGAVDGMRIGKRNQSIRRKPAPMSRCLPQIPHDPIGPRIWAAAVESRGAHKVLLPLQ
jgi:hypothetical protein